MRRGNPKFTRTRRDNRWGNVYGPYDGLGFHIVLEGGCWLIQKSTSPIRLDAGDVVFFPRGAEHGLSDRPSIRIDQLPAAPVVDVDDDSHSEPGQLNRVFLLCGAYRLSHGRTHPLLDALPEVIHLPAENGRDARLRSVIELLAVELQEAGPGSDAALPALLDLLLVHVIRIWLEDQAHVGRGADWHGALTDPRVASALIAIHEETERPWTLQSLATRSGMSRSAFARRFTELVGQTPVSYLNWWRLNMSTIMLKQSEATIRTVAHRVGYGSEFAFANAFKREFGIAPGQYRRRETERFDAG